MGLLDELNVVDPIVNGNLPPINDSSANTNINSQQLPYNPPVATANYILNFQSPHRNFLDAISEYGASVPLKSFWIVQFKIPSLITENNLNNLSEKFRDNDFAKQTLSNDKFMKNVGCIFCRSFNFVGEANNSVVPEMDIRGFRSVPYAGGRSSNMLNNFTVTFYESTVSFLDHIIRPWTLLMSYYSTIARNNGSQANNSILDLKQDITCHLMTRTGVGKTDAQREANKQLNSYSNQTIPNYNNPWNVRKSIVFKNCFPKDTGTIEYNQSDTGGLETTATTFCFTNYEVIYNPFVFQSSNTTSPLQNVNQTPFTNQALIANQNVA